MANIDIDALLSASSGDATPQCRRQIIGQLVTTLSEFARELIDHEERSQRSIARLSATIQTMAGSIATADDATFSAIVQEAAMLIRTLRHRQLDLARFTVH